ncbi:MAG: DUF503 domain-containing protein [Desulfovibrio sp.]
MIIGVLKLEFRLHGNRSLKGKRKVSQSIKQRLRNTFNVSVSEVAAHEDHQRLCLAAVTVSTDSKRVDSILAKAMEAAQQNAPAEFLRGETEIFSDTGEIEI